MQLDKLIIFKVKQKGYQILIPNDQVITCFVTFLCLLHVNTVHVKRIEWAEPFGISYSFEITYCRYMYSTDLALHQATCTCVHQCNVI